MLSDRATKNISTNQHDTFKTREDVSANQPDLYKTTEDVRTSQPDPYASHLAEVNTDNEVHSTEDIYNNRGVLITQKGSRINHEAAEQILQHRLQKPLETQVQLDKSIDGSFCLEKLHQLFKRYPDLKQIHDETGFDAICNKLMAWQKLPPLLIQKLTVQTHQMEEIFEKSLFIAWLSALMAKEMGLDQESIHATSLAGLFADIGFLHIDPTILNKKSLLSRPEWRAIQSHVVIGQLVTKGLGLPESIPKAILEHHERCDGSGYPTGADEASLGLLGQIIGMADTMQAIRVKQFSKNNRTLGDAMPYLQLNPTTHFYEVYQALINILRHSGLKPSPINPLQNNAKLISTLQDRTYLLKYAGHLLEQVVEILLTSKGGAKRRSLLKTSTRMLTAMTTSGMAREEILQWFESLDDNIDKNTLAELNEIELMQNELLWQTKSIHKAFDEFFEQENINDTPQSPLHKLSQELDNCLSQLANVAPQ